MNRIMPTQGWLDRVARYESRKQQPEQQIDSMTGAGRVELLPQEQPIKTPSAFDEEQARLEALNMMSTGQMNVPPVRPEQQEQFLADNEMKANDSQDEDIIPPTNFYQPFDTSNITTNQPAQEPPAQDKSEQDNKNKNKNKAVDDIITKRALSEPNLSNNQRQAIIDRYEERHGKFNAGALLAGFGTAMQGRGAAGTDDVFANQRQRMQDELDAFDTNREQAYEDELRERERETYENERDPNSNISITARDYLAQMGIPVPANASYNQIQKMYPFAMDKLNLDIKRSEIERTEAESRFQVQQDLLKRTTDFGEALDEEGAKTVKNLTTQSNSILGNIRNYSRLLREGGSDTEKRRQRKMLAAELASLDPALMPPASKEEWESILEDGYFEFDSTTAKRVDELIDYISGNARATIKDNLSDTAIERFNSPQALRQLGIDKIRMIDPRDGQAKYVYVERYQDALRKGWREVK